MKKWLNISLVISLALLSLISAFYIWSPLLITREENPILFSQDIQNLKIYLDQKYTSGVYLVSISLLLNWLMAVSYLYRMLVKEK